MSSDALARLAEIEAENEELGARLDAAERGSADADALRTKNEETRRRLARARSEAADLRARRVAIEEKKKQTSSFRLVVGAFIVGLVVGLRHAR